MRQFILFQNILDGDLVNNLGWSEAAKVSPAVEAYLAVGVMGDAEKWKPEYYSSYKMVAGVDVEAAWGETIEDSLEDVFAAGNYQDRKNVKIEEIQRRRSVSVGDLIMDMSDKSFYLVASFGFEKVAVK